jgi:hypothetical protein
MPAMPNVYDNPDFDYGVAYQLNPEIAATQEAQRQALLPRLNSVSPDYLKQMQGAYAAPVNEANAKLAALGGTAGGGGAGSVQVNGTAGDMKRMAAEAALANYQQQHRQQIQGASGYQDLTSWQQQQRAAENKANYDKEMAILAQKSADTQDAINTGNTVKNGAMSVVNLIAGAVGGGMGGGMGGGKSGGGTTTPTQPSDDWMGDYGDDEYIKQQKRQSAKNLTDPSKQSYFWDDT